MVKLRLAVLGLALALPAAPVLALADDIGVSSAAGRLAPADEYFGHMKMSVLGIANTIHDAGRRLDEGASPEDMLRGPLYFAVDALRDWERKYPNDHWIPRDLLALERVYMRAGSQESQAMARRTARWLLADYPESFEAREARVAVGEIERPSYAGTVPTYAHTADDENDQDDDGN